MIRYEFSFLWFFIGIALMVAGVLTIRFHQKLADSLAGGVVDYDRFKLFGIIACGVGLLFMTNLHSTIFYLFLHFIMPGTF